jgi:hypothetical protein
LLLGTHELELHSVIERLVSNDFRTIINVGAALGYYAIGFAVRCPRAEVIAFERLADWRSALVAGAEANGVAPRLSALGNCTIEALKDCVGAVQPPLLVIADLEGNEMEIFDQEMAGRLAAATVLIETHDDRIPGATKELLQRFGATHRAEAFAPRGRTRSDIPSTLVVGAWRMISQPLVWLMNEMRPTSQRWLLFTPLNGA